MQNKADSSSEINYAFSFHRNKSWKANEYSTGWERFGGWDHLARAITKVAWSPCIWKADHRISEDFIFSDFLALDIDNGPSLDEMMNAMADSVVMIGTTRSHRKPKLGIVADRYRVIIPWERRITDADEYRASITAYIKRYDADKCSDTARLLWPCTEIVMRQDPEPGLELATVSLPEPPKEYKRRLNEHTGEIVLSKNIINFLTRGLVFGDGRNVSVFVTAKELFSCGGSEREIIDLIKGAPFERQGFPDREIESTVRSAIKRN